MEFRADDSKWQVIDILKIATGNIVSGLESSVELVAMFFEAIEEG